MQELAAIVNRRGIGQPVACKREFEYSRDKRTNSSVLFTQYNTIDARLVASVGDSIFERPRPQAAMDAALGPVVG